VLIKKHKKELSLLKYTIKTVTYIYIDCPKQVEGNQNLYVNMRKFRLFVNLN